ncbi:MAG: hypothetical protein Unbinned706contig1001_16 [Prokaryotic dsDNA virus sp.]|nr:MAG: hypothetical protein Unbinned706contig1001_16 [Prokaryotic dsDNA virus sp.]|tara:strand:- start:15270 stop:15734 length:465 start_codon:yes stop_codon:yes gene_type:complete
MKSDLYNNIPRYYGRLVLEREFYSKLERQTSKDLLKFYTYYEFDELLTFHKKIDELILYYEMLEDKNFLVDKEEIMTDLLDNYFEWFKLTRSNVGCDSTLLPGKQIYIMFKRLQELYYVLKPMKEKGDFIKIHKRIEKYRLHRKHKSHKYKRIF